MTPAPSPALPPNRDALAYPSDADGRATRTCRVRQTTRSDGWAAKVAHGHSLWIEPCECREGCKHSTEAAVSGRSLNRTGHGPASRRPPRQRSIQHEVVSSTVIRPCSREHLPGTLLLLLPPIRGVGVRPGSPWMDTRNLPSSWGAGSQGARPSDPKRSRPSYRGHVAYRHNSCRQVLSGRFCIGGGRFSFCLLSLSSCSNPPPIHTNLVPRARTSCLSYSIESCLDGLVKSSSVCLTVWITRSGQPVLTAAHLPPRS